MTKISDTAILTALRRRPKGMLTVHLQELFIKEGILPPGERRFDDLQELIGQLSRLEDHGKVTSAVARDDKIGPAILWTRVRSKAEAN